MNISINLVLHCKTITGNTPEEVKQDVINKLCDIASSDCDFNGENGDSFLWEIAKERGFDNNLEYTASIAMKEDSPVEAAKTFVEMWLGGSNYYKIYCFDYETNCHGALTSIAVAYNTMQLCRRLSI